MCDQVVLLHWYCTSLLFDKETDILIAVQLSSCCSIMQHTLPPNAHQKDMKELHTKEGTKPSAQRTYKKGVNLYIQKLCTVQTQRCSQVPQ